MLFPLRLTFWVIVSIGLLWLLPFAIEDLMTPNMVDPEKCSLGPTCEKLMASKLQSSVAIE